MASSSSQNPGNMLSSPNPIPPRRSSSATHNHNNSTSSNTRPSTAVPDAVPEAVWMSPKATPVKPGSSGTASSSTPTTGHRRYYSASSGITAPGQTMAEQLDAAGPPPADPDRYATDSLDFTPDRTWTDEKEGAVRAPYNYVISHPGKDFRAQLISAFNAWLEVPPATLEIITHVVGMLHEASLLVDDVQDNSELRRGYPVAHNIFGVAQTINAANYMYFTALRELQKLTNPDAVATFADELVNLHRGQGMDLFWRDNLKCPTEEDYLEMVGNKTGGLFRLGIKLMQAESKASVPTDCVALVNLVGLIFQIRDDYMNLSSSQYTQNKGMCEDLTEGKFSFPVIHSIRADPTNPQLISILKQRTTDVQVKRYAVDRMEATGSFKYTRRVIDVLIARARRTAHEIDAGRNKLAGILKILDNLALRDSTTKVS